MLPALPTDSWLASEAHRRQLRRERARTTRHASRGELRKAIATYLCDFRGANCDPDQIVGVGVTQQAMLACSLALINGGEVAWIEDRVFHQARNVLALSGPKSSRARSHRHDAAVNNARPHSKPNEAEVCERIARCGNKEHTERGINANDHERVVRVACVPRPTQPGDHQRVNAENKNDADEDEGDA